MQNLSRAGQVLSGIIVALTVVASAGGLLIPGLYRDNAFVTANWLGSDLVDLLVVAPLLAAATVLAARGSIRAHLVWLGLLQTTLYNFAYYLFGAAFNWFFPVYVALFGISIWTLVAGLIGLDVGDIRAHFGARTPTRAIGAYMLIVGLGLSTVYLANWLMFVIGGQLPSIISRTGHPTNEVFALDLSLVIPLFVVGGIWLWQRKPWGYVLAAIANVKGAVYLIGLCASTWTVYAAGTTDSPAEIVIWASIAACCLAAAGALLASLKRDPQPPAPGLACRSEARASTPAGR